MALPRVILLHALAPPKPEEGEACNGCGVCCAAQPCPLGMLVSRRRHGACAALVWDEGGRYRCGVVSEARRFVPFLPAAWTRALALRWISASQGCDSDLEPAG
jgi:hypothetical protein